MSAADARLARRAGQSGVVFLLVAVSAALAGSCGGSEGPGGGAPPGTAAVERAPPGWLKGAYHVHSTEHDGLPVAQLIELYVSRGYDFIVLTPNSYGLAGISRDVPVPDGFLVVPGIETKERDGCAKTSLAHCAHVGAVGAWAPILQNESLDTAERIQDVVCAIRRAGGVPVMNHPEWARWGAKGRIPSEALAGVRGRSLLEVYNTTADSGSPPEVFPILEEKWARLLAAGKHVWGIAGDDSHSYTPERPLAHGKTAVYVRGTVRTAVAIAVALDEGSFYFATGDDFRTPVLAGYEVERDGATGALRTISLTLAPYGGCTFSTWVVGERGPIEALPGAVVTIEAARYGSAWLRTKTLCAPGAYFPTGTGHPRDLLWTQPVWMVPQDFAAELARERAACGVKSGM